MRTVNETLDTLHRALGAARDNDKLAECLAREHGKTLPDAKGDIQRGLDVVAVDPIAEMLELLRGALPATPALLGTAEQIPLRDNSVDAVLVAQAWHWFDPKRAIAEVARLQAAEGYVYLKP